MKTVKSLEQMESIVLSNKSLSWDGWTVLHSQKSDRGATSVNGQLKNGKWHIVNRYEPSKDGWLIPDKFVG
jgi:hypothetical protein